MVSAIVLNWNGKDVTPECVESLLRQSYGLREIIVVDNGSTDGSLELIRREFGARVKIVENARNLGFAGGCNVGIRAAAGEYIALINSDATLDTEWMSELVKGIERTPSMGMAACKIYFAGQEGILENTGQVVTRDGLGRTRGRLEKDVGQYDHRSAVLCPSGCAALYRRKMLDEIDLFDERFFAYADDIDIGIRGRLLGYKCFYIPTAVAYHKLSASFGLLSSFKAYLVERNRLWVLIKCYPLRHLAAAPLHTLVRYGYHFYGIFRHRGPAARFVEKISLWNLLGIMIKVYLSTLWNLPHLLRERRKIWRQSKADAREFELWLKQYGISARDAALNEISY